MKSRFQLVIRRATRNEFVELNDSSCRSDEQAQASMEDETLKQNYDTFKWLKHVPMDDEQNNFTRIREAYQGTGHWLLEVDSFMDWLHPDAPTPAPLLWLYGDPGAGKSDLQIVASLI